MHIASKLQNTNMNILLFSTHFYKLPKIYQLTIHHTINCHTQTITLEPLKHLIITLTTKPVLSLPNKSLPTLLTLTILLKVHTVIFRVCRQWLLLHHCHISADISFHVSCHVSIMTYVPVNW